MTFPIHFALIQVIHLLGFGLDHTAFSITLEDISYGMKHRKVHGVSVEECLVKDDMCNSWYIM
jgi:hypothetical protein